MKLFDVRTRSIDVTASTLSGGNQQKLILARELETDPRLLIAAQPTRGLDVGAIEFVWTQILEQKAAGRAVLLISAELDEIYALSDRIVTIYEGRITGEFAPDAAPEEIGVGMLGGASARGVGLMASAPGVRRRRRPRSAPIGSSGSAGQFLALLGSLPIALVLGAVLIVAYGESPPRSTAPSSSSPSGPRQLRLRPGDRDAADLLGARGRRVLQGRPVQHRRRRPVPRRRWWRRRGRR